MPTEDSVLIGPSSGLAIQVGISISGQFSEITPKLTYKTKNNLILLFHLIY